MSSGLDRGDYRKLKKGFLTSLNDLSSGLQDKCFSKLEVYNKTGLFGYSEFVIPYIFQELLDEGLVKECNKKDNVSITSKGIKSLDRTIENNVKLILDVMNERVTPKNGLVKMDGQRIKEITGLTPSEINDAVKIMVENNLIESFSTLGTHPYGFRRVQLTPRGKFVYQSRSKQENQTENSMQMNPKEKVILNVGPVGSPYGFTADDWEEVDIKKQNNSVLYVVFGFQFESKFYNSENLKRNIKNMFEKGVEKYKKTINALEIQLDFKFLEAGYGEHLFNRIACDIISSDIAIFDTSDKNPNVMIELGVALTWGIRVLQILDQKSYTKQPSDISGQTWAQYSKDGEIFLDAEHQKKLVNMIERVVRSKQNRS